MCCLLFFKIEPSFPPGCKVMYLFIYLFFRLFMFIYLFFDMLFYFIYFIFAVLGFELRAYILSHFFFFLRQGLLELFAWAGFEPRSC
jgi:hypothetical protein